MSTDNSQTDKTMATTNYRAFCPEVDAYLTNLQEGVKRVVLSQHIESLRDFAFREITLGETLSDEEVTERGVRMRETLVIARSLRTPLNQIVSKVLNGIV